MNGDEVRDVRFCRDHGYDASQVDERLRRVAVEFDAGRPAGPLIANTTFWPGKPGYEIHAVDWFLDQLRRREDPSQSARLNADPWRHLPVGNQFTRNGPGDPADRTAETSRRGRRKHEAARREQDQKDLSQECADAWRDFGQQPGTHLLWRQAGIIGGRKLRTADQQTIASLRYDQRGGVSTDGRTFTWKRVTGSSLPRIAEIVARNGRDRDAHYLAEDTPGNQKHQAKARPIIPKVRELVDETGMPILYTSGKNYNGRAGACITFPDQRWLRFPVRGTDTSNAIMTAVDQAGNKIARYRLIGKTKAMFHLTILSFIVTLTMEITVHPDQPLTDELVLAIAISAQWLRSYFDFPAQ